MRAAMPLSDSAPTEGGDGYWVGSSRRRLGNVEGHRVEERTHGGAMLPLSDAALACLTLFRGAGWIASHADRRDHLRPSIQLLEH